MLTIICRDAKKRPKKGKKSKSKKKADEDKPKAEGQPLELLEKFLSSFFSSALVQQAAFLVIIMASILGASVAMHQIKMKIADIESMTRCANVTRTTTSTTSTTTTTTSTTTEPPIVTLPLLTATVKEKSNNQARRNDRREDTPYLHLCTRDEWWPEGSVNDDVYLGDVDDGIIDEENIGKDYMPGCRYYFVLDRQVEYAEAERYCRDKFGAFMAHVEDSQEECAIGHHLQKLNVTFFF